MKPNFTITQGGWKTSTLLMQHSKNFNKIKIYSVINNIYFMRSKNTKAFQRLCNNIDGRRFLVLANTVPITTPSSIRGSILCILKCARAKATELTKIEHHTGIYFVSDGRRNPRNTISSQMGAQTDTTTA